MKKVFFFLFILSDEAAPSLPAEGRTFKEPSRVMKPKEPSLHFNNRPLAKINGKTISLIDVINKMDLALFDYNPEFLNSTLARYQFYTQSWKQTLEDMINTEMILLEGEEKELKATDGEIREAMLERFGPSIIASLEMIRITYEDAREMIRKELIVEQLMGVKVHTKAMQAVTPQVIRKGYEEYLAKHLSEGHGLLNVKFGEEKKLYMQALTKRFGFDQHDPHLPLPENYTPFVLY
ncbi:MAG: hypothetical protein HYZ47_03585 [Simkania negevensis]|nr:hypothetical protein [Simkania negevensis]